MDLKICAGIFILISVGGSVIASGTNGTCRGLRCCDGKDFVHYGDELQFDILQKCSVPPKDPQMSFVNASWLAYECLVEGILDGKPLTASNYFNLMTKNMTAEARAKFLQYLDAHPEISEPQNLSETEVAPMIRTFWDGFFEAQQEICILPQIENTTDNRLLHHSQRENKCRKNTFPLVVYRRKWVERNPSQCIQTFFANLENITGSLMTIRYLCYFGEDLNVNITQLQLESSGVPKFKEHLNLIPKFFSTSTVTKMWLQFFQNLINRYGTEATKHLNLSSTSADNMETIQKQIYDDVIPQMEKSFYSGLEKAKQSGRQIENPVFLKRAFILTEMLFPWLNIKTKYCLYYR